MDPLLIVVIVVAALALLGGGWMANRRRGDQDAAAQAAAQATAQAAAQMTAQETAQRAADAQRMADSQAELIGRIAQLAEAQNAGQMRMAEQMQIQERELSRKLEVRLADVGRRVGESLEKSSVQAQTSLTDLKERLAVIDTAQKNLTELSGQVTGLQDILSNKQARGAFGEVQLEDIVRSALPPNAYDFQVTLSNSKRVDCLVRLPNPPGSIAIDAKFPLESYRALRAADDDAQRQQARRGLATDVLNHVKAIADRYIVSGETAESALLFLPSEAVYAELHASLPEVIDQSYRARVWIVSPTTLMATLNTVRAVLKDVQMREQAHVIQKEVGILMEDVGRLDDRASKLETHFQRVEKDVHDIRVSTSKISRRGDQIKKIELGEEQSTARSVEVQVDQLSQFSNSN